MTTRRRGLAVVNVVGSFLLMQLARASLHGVAKSRAPHSVCDIHTTSSGYSMLQKWRFPSSAWQNLTSNETVVVLAPGSANRSLRVKDGQKAPMSNTVGQFRGNATVSNSIGLSTGIQNSHRWPVVGSISSILGYGSPVSASTFPIKHTKSLVKQTKDGCMEAKAAGAAIVLSEVGFEEVVSRHCKWEVAVFVESMVRELNLRITNKHEFHEVFLHSLMEVAEDLTYDGLRDEVEQLSLDPCSWLVPTQSEVQAGSSAALNEEGYRAVVRQRNPSDMIFFVERLMDDMNLIVVDQGGLAGFLPYFNCEKGTGTLKKMQKAIWKEFLKGKPWLIKFSDASREIQSKALKSRENRKLLMRVQTQRKQKQYDFVKLNESSFRKAKTTKSKKHLLSYVLSVIERMNLHVVDYAYFLDVFLPSLETERQWQKLSEIKAGLSKSSKDPCAWIMALEEKAIKSGKAAPLNEMGYRAVARMRNSVEMTYFVERLLSEMDLVITDKGGMAGFLPFFDCEKGAKSLEALREELKQQPWLVAFAHANQKQRKEAAILRKKLGYSKKHKAVETGSTRHETVEKGRASKVHRQNMTKHKTMEKGSTSQNHGQHETQQESLKKGRASNKHRQNMTKHKAMEKVRTNEMAGHDVTRHESVGKSRAHKMHRPNMTKHKTMEKGNTSQKRGQQETQQEALENGVASKRHWQNMTKHKPMRNGSTSEMLGQKVLKQDTLEKVITGKRQDHDAPKKQDFTRSPRSRSEAGGHASAATARKNAIGNAEATMAVSDSKASAMRKNETSPRSSFSEMREDRADVEAGKAAIDNHFQDPLANEQFDAHKLREMEARLERLENFTRMRGEQWSELRGAARANDASLPSTPHSTHRGEAQRAASSDRSDETSFDNQGAFVRTHASEAIASSSAVVEKDRIATEHAVPTNQSFSNMEDRASGVPSSTVQVDLKDALRERLGSMVSRLKKLKAVKVKHAHEFIAGERDAAVEVSNGELVARQGVATGTMIDAGLPDSNGTAQANNTMKLTHHDRAAAAEQGLVPTPTGKSVALTKHATEAMAHYGASRSKEHVMAMPNSSLEGTGEELRGTFAKLASRLQNLTALVGQQKRLNLSVGKADTHVEDDEGSAALAKSAAKTAGRNDVRKTEKVGAAVFVNTPQTSAEEERKAKLVKMVSRLENLKGFIVRDS